MEIATADTRKEGSGAGETDEDSQLEISTTGTRKFGSDLEGVENGLRYYCQAGVLTTENEMGR